MALAIGSGNAGKSYLWWRGDALFQSPLAWYREKRRWDLSPGYDADPHPNFLRPVTSECLFCHAANVKPVAGTQNRYLQGTMTAITCARCHGSGDAHAARPSRDNIVNPGRLPLLRRDSICESCHLSGEARIPNPGRRFEDFQPGMQLEQVFTVYTGGPDGKLKVVSHAEQMAASRCATRSAGKLWCASCHDPHSEPDPAQKAAFYRTRCQQCHATAHRPDEDCAGCHMPRSQAYDGGHTAFTDHRVQIPGSAAPMPDPALKPWRPPADPSHASRNLALAWLAVSEKRQSLPALQQAVRLLNSLLAKSDSDPALATAVGLVALRQDKPQQALAFLRQAFDPASATSHANLAAAYLAAGDRAAAIRHAQEAIRIEPLLESAYAILAQADSANAAQWRATFRKRIGP